MPKARPYVRKPDPKKEGVVHWPYTLPPAGYEGKMKPGAREVDNPYDVGPERITVTCNTRNDAIESLMARGRITEAQKQAGDRVRTLYEKVEGSGARGIDYADQRVDGGKIATTVNLTQLEAIESLGNLSKRVGKVGYAVLVSCAGQGLSLRQVADTWSEGRASRSEMDFISGTLQAALGEAAVYFGLASPSTAPSARVGTVKPSKRP